MSETHSGARMRGVLFDKDGTLIDLHASWVGAGLATARRMCDLAGAPGRFDALVDAAGYDARSRRLDPRSLWASGTTESLVRHWHAELALDGGEVLVREMLDHMTEEAARQVTPLADLARLFAMLAESGMRVGVATMDLEGSARRSLDRLGVLAQLDFVCGCDSGHGVKPGPGMVLAFCRACGLQPSQVMVVGDTPHDMDMARAAGAGMVVAVTSGAADAQMLAPLADHVLADVSTLDRLLAG